MKRENTKAAGIVGIYWKRMAELAKLVSIVYIVNVLAAQLELGEKNGEKK